MWDKLANSLDWYLTADSVPEILRQKVEVTWLPVVKYNVYRNGQTKEERLHGPRVTENVVMGIEVDIMRRGWKNAIDAGFEIVHECYDELLAEVPVCKDERKLKETFRNCLLDQPEWVERLGIPVDVPLDDMWVGKRYRK